MLHDRQSIPAETVPPVYAQVCATEASNLPIDQQETQTLKAVVPVTVQEQGLSTPSPLIVVRNLKKTYPGNSNARLVLDDISLYIERGEFVVITGPPGAGKSTLLHILGCMTRPSAGAYWLAGCKVNLFPMDTLATLRNQQLGFIFQEPALLPRTSALKNVALPLLYAGFAAAEQKRRAQKALQAVGLSSRLLYTPERLSPGQQQRVALARALVNSPSLLVADEPIGNMDTRSGTEIMAVLQALNRRNLTIVLATQNSDLAVYATRHVILHAGRIASDEPVPVTRKALADLEETPALLALAQKKVASTDVQRCEETV
jgi:putative ABC transport system ATP-binding protein